MQTRDRDAGYQPHAVVCRCKGAVLPFSHGVVLREAAPLQQRTGLPALPCLEFLSLEQPLQEQRHHRPQRRQKISLMLISVIVS